MIPWIIRGARYRQSAYKLSKALEIIDPVDEQNAGSGFAQLAIWVVKE
jgi:hypothetical protein